MSYELLKAVNQKWSKTLQEDGTNDFMVYEPFTDKYWKEPIKICMCNLEGYGYEDCGITLVDLKIFSQWMKDTHITKTCRYVSVFVNVLLELLNSQRKSITDIQTSYNEFDKLVNAISRTSYMNFRKTSNSLVPQNAIQIKDEVSTYKSLIQEFIHELEPDILLVGGKLGVESFNNVFEPDQPLIFNQYLKLNKMLVCSINHLSRPDYSYFLNKSQDIIAHFKN